MKPTKIALALGLALSLCAPAWAEGAQCTFTYPQGFAVTNFKLVKIKKKLRVRHVRVCTNGEFGATWRVCELRYRT
jgi:hypothetical protein